MQTNFVIHERQKSLGKRSSKVKPKPNQKPQKPRRKFTFADSTNDEGKQQMSNLFKGVQSNQFLEQVDAVMSISNDDVSQEQEKLSSFRLNNESQNNSRPDEP